jgi:hypothetical protein
MIGLVAYYLLWARSRFRGPVAQGTAEQLTEIEKEFQVAAGDLAQA